MKAFRIFLLLILPATGLRASLSVVHQVSASADANDTTISCPAMATSSGNLEVVFFRQTNNATLPISVTNTAGDVFTGMGQSNIGPPLGDDAITHFYFPNITGNAADVITVTWGGVEQFRRITCYEIAGADPVSPLDQVVEAIQQTGVTSITSDPFTTTQADEIILAGIGTSSTTASYTPDTGYTLGPTLTNSAAATEYKIVSTIQTGVTAAMSADETINLGMVVVTYKAAAAPGTGAVRHRVTQE